MDRRTKARELSMQALFQLDVQGEDALEFIEKFLKENAEDDLILTQASRWTLGTWENLTKCDQLIQSAAVRWQLSRISAVERSILRLSAYQMAYCPDIPGKVAINEGIEMAKRFCSAQSPGFINGVLDAVMRKIKENEQPATD